MFVRNNGKKETFQVTKDVSTLVYCGLLEQEKVSKQKKMQVLASMPFTAL